VERLTKYTPCLAGALSGLALAPVFFWPILFVTVPQLIQALDRTPTARHAFFTGWLFGFGYHLVGLHWMHAGLHLVSPETHRWTGPLTVIAMPATLALFWGLAAAIARRGRVVSPGAIRFQGKPLSPSIL
jgi:apolipoprotein N-acyltransferase